MKGFTKLVFRRTKKVDNDLKDIVVEEVLKQAETLDCTMIKLPILAKSQFDPANYKCRKKDHYIMSMTIIQTLIVK